MRTLLFALGIIGLTALVMADTPYHKKVDRELNEWNAKVESLQERSQKAGENTRQVLERDTRELQAKLKEARAALNDMVANGSEKSKPMRQSIEKALKEIRNLYRTAVSHFKSSDAKEEK